MLMLSMPLAHFQKRLVGKFFLSQDSKEKNLFPKPVLFFEHLERKSS